MRTLNFSNSWPERGTKKKVSNQMLGEHLKREWGRNVAKRHAEVIHALQLMESLGDIDSDSCNLLLHGGYLENAKFLSSIDEVVRNNMRYDESAMAMEGLTKGIQGVVAKTRLEWFDDNGFTSDTPREDMEKVLRRQGQERHAELQNDPVYDLNEGDDTEGGGVRRNDIGEPQLSFEPMTDDNEPTGDDE